MSYFFKDLNIPKKFLSNPELNKLTPKQHVS